MDYELLWNRLKREARAGTDLPFCHGWLTDMMQLMEKEAEEETEPSGPGSSEQACEGGGGGGGKGGWLVNEREANSVTDIGRR